MESLHTFMNGRVLLLILDGMKFLFLFLLIIFAVDNVLILNEEKLLVDHF